jgi:hypothetical protein
MNSFFFYGGVFALAIALLPIEALGSPPAWSASTLLS